jgi:GNAT superfamily N-acetyltransferase
MEIELLADRCDAIPIISRWSFEQWGRRVADNTLEATIERMRQRLNRDRLPLGIVATDGPTILGAAQLKIREMDIYPQYEHWLGGVYVAAQARGKGLASRLAQEIAERAKEFDVQKLYLQTERLAGGLYARLRWKPIEQADYHGLRMLVMVRELTCRP